MFVTQSCFRLQFKPFIITDVVVILNIVLINVRTAYNLRERTRASLVVRFHDCQLNH